MAKKNGTHKRLGASRRNCGACGFGVGYITRTGIIYTLSLGLIDRKLADGIHRATNVPLAVFFLTHILINIKLAVSEKHKPGRWLTPSLIIIGLILLGIVIYMEYLVPR